MKTQATKAFVAAAFIFAASAVSAGPITTWTVDVTTVFDTSSVLPNSGITATDTSLRWGSSDQSGIDITDSPASGQVDTNGSAVANVSITHLNQPINGTTLESVNILSTLTLTAHTPSGGPQVGPNTITFGINFKETSNKSAGSTCADGSNYGVGVNINGCADIFVIDKSSLNFEFFYDDLDGSGVTDRSYFISFFELTNGLNPLTSAACLAATGSSAACFGFETPEGANTTFQFASLITTERVSVPEPGILALFGAALSSIFFTRRRKA